jgi:hypothetical protein
VTDALEPGKRLHLAATIAPELLADLPNDNDRREGRSQIREVAGAGLERKPATAIRAWAVFDLAGKRWLREGFW